MKILNVQQGSPEWLAARAKHHCASDAPAMMGVGKYLTRDELLRQKVSGHVPDVDAFKQALFDKGHEAEAAARSIIEDHIGEELFPATATDDDGRLLASFDGITMDGTTGYEHKLWNEELAARVRANDLPPAYFWQLEHQAIVAGLKRIIFVCSDGTREKMVSTEYVPVPGRAQQLLAGWRQFDEDVKNYQHVENKPQVVAEPVVGLPAVSIQVNGPISLISNLDVFGVKLKAFVEGINKNPADDQDFANCEAAVKTLQTAQDALDQAENAALAQTASMDEMRKTVSMYRDLARDTRLMLKKLVDSRKDAIREEIRQGGVTALAQHVTGLNTRLGKQLMPVVPADFAGVMKGKKTISSLRDAVNTELARTKIEANAIADRIDINLKQLAKAEFAFLFADEAQIVQKQPDDLELLIKSRINEHKEREWAKQEEARKASIAASMVTTNSAALTGAASTAASPSATMTTPAPVAEPTYEQGYVELQAFVTRYSKVTGFARIINAFALLKAPTQKKAA